MVEMLPSFLGNRIALRWFLCFVLTGLLIVVWFGLQPVLILMANTVENALQSQGMNSTDTNNTLTLYQLTANITIPILIVAIWLWAIVSSQPEEWRGYHEQR